MAAACLPLFFQVEKFRIGPGVSRQEPASKKHNACDGVPERFPAGRAGCRAGGMAGDKDTLLLLLLPHRGSIMDAHTHTQWQLEDSHCPSVWSLLTKASKIRFRSLDKVKLSLNSIMSRDSKCV